MFNLSRIHTHTRTARGHVIHERSEKQPFLDFVSHPGPEIQMNRSSENI